MESYIVQLGFSATFDIVVSYSNSSPFVQVAVCCPFLRSSSPTVSKESWLMVLLVRGSQSFLACHREVSVLITLLFILYISEMFEMVENTLYAYEDYSTLLAVVCKPADRPAVAAFLNRDLATIQEWCNHWCVIVNPN